MKFINFDIEKKGSEKLLTEALIYANATFDIKEFLSKKTPLYCSSVSILTAKQTMNCAFHYSLFKSLHHAAIADLMLSRLYPNHKRRTDQGIYGIYNKEDIFILGQSFSFTAVIPNNNITLTKHQLHDLTDLLKNAKQSDYYKKDKMNGEIIFKGLYWGNNFYKMDEVDSLLNYLKKRTCEKKCKPQYNFSNYSFSSCRTEKDILKRLSIYAENHFDNKNLIYGDEGR